MSNWVFIALSLHVLLNCSSILVSTEIKEQTASKSILNKKEKYEEQESPESNFNITLKNIAIPRVSGTENNTQVRDYIVNRMSQLGWTVALDSFEDKTTMGVKSFSNIIATHNDQVCNRFVMACHFDSKYFSDIEFIGAVDSAVPCAMIISLAQLLNQELIKHKEKKSDPTLQFIFFDGEEAFKTWSSTDSLYGSRHLANELTKSKPKNPNCQVDNDLKRINAMILLDLIGAPDPVFLNYFESTSHLYQKLILIEKKYNKKTEFFKNISRNSWIEDDHIPFMERGVPVLHLIANPFPKVWHKQEDNVENLDFATIDILMNIFRDFLMELLKL